MDYEKGTEGNYQDLVEESGIVLQITIVSLKLGLILLNADVATRRENIPIKEGFRIIIFLLQVE